MIAPIHNMLALINPAALPALRIAATFFFLIYLAGGAYIFLPSETFHLESELGFFRFVPIIAHDICAAWPDTAE